MQKLASTREAPHKPLQIKGNTMLTRYTSRLSLATLLENLADGETVELGEFAGNDNSKDDTADEQAEILRILAAKLRRANTGRLLG